MYQTAPHTTGVLCSCG